MKLWKDMTPEEKGALLLAYHEGKVIEHTIWSSKEWFEAKKGVHSPLSWHDDLAYRVKPEPKKPREFWLVNLEAFTSEWEAKQAQDVRGGVIIHVVEKVE